MNVEHLLRDALGADASGIDPGPGDWRAVETKAAAVRRRRARTAALAGAGLVAAAVLAVVALGGLVTDDGSSTVVVDQPPAPTGLPGPTPTSTPGPGQPAEHRAEGYLPLWPFATFDEAVSWQGDGEPGGHSPWHADAGATALFFSSGYLGYADIDRIVSQDVGATEARVTVGYHDDQEGNRDFPAAVVHLVRYGRGGDAPWEVVGTDDTDLSLSTPKYGSTASSPLEVGGRITGVDESLDVAIRQMNAEKPLGDSCCLPAGDVDSPWRVSLSFSGATPGAVATISVSTGGHLKGVERFAVTGVRLH